MLACRTGTLNNLLFKEKNRKQKKKNDTHTEQEKRKKGDKRKRKRKTRNGKKLYKCQINSIKANLTLKQTTHSN